MGLYDRDYMKSDEWKMRNGYYTPKYRGKSLYLVLLVLAIIVVFLILFNSCSAYSSTISEGILLAQGYKFDTETIDPQENNWHNLLVAAEYLKKWKPTDINKALKVSVKDLYKHTWKYIGKLVRLTIEVLMPEELPPSNAFSKILNPGKPSTVMLADVDIGGAGDAIQYHYAGPFEGFDAGDKVEICGYVIGKCKNTNRFGGTCYNIIIAGKYIKKVKK